jgi:hypothetical protein
MIKMKKLTIDDMKKSRMPVQDAIEHLLERIEELEKKDD